MLSTYHTLKVKILKGKGKPPIKIFFSKLYYEFLRLIGDNPPIQLCASGAFLKDPY